jgi:hypothetical protein
VFGFVQIAKIPVVPILPIRVVKHNRIFSSLRALSPRQILTRIRRNMKSYATVPLLTSMMTGPRNWALAGPSSRMRLARASPSLRGGGCTSLSFFKYLHTVVKKITDLGQWQRELESVRTPSFRRFQPLLCIQIRIKLKGRIRIRIRTKVTTRIRIRIEVMRIRNTDFNLAIVCGEVQ